MSVAAATKRWTLEEVHSLPDDGNKYELVRGDLFVTPPPNQEHETIASRLTDILAPHVRAHGLGLVYRPRAVFRYKESEVEPDLMVRQPPRGRKEEWENAPFPILIVEILSDSTRRRDRNQKREFYVDAEIPEYWIVDPAQRNITVVRPGAEDFVASESLAWTPPGASQPLTLPVSSVFGTAP
jgi:Uma2 family endonuclease